MALDLTKLNPAPWAVEVIETFSVIRDEHTCGAMLLPENDDNENHLAALEFAALARNAFEVMLKRGWHPEKRSMGWMVCEDMNGDTLDGSFHGDPFSALVAADAWYRENVEPKQQ